ncbi:MAG: ATP phosphoribosyltransferase regulatory subunit [Actinobacteria bacterium]|nr:ATP phosphoribosyltransferase regulatory subunit [Actinomycetota bacterium]
MLPDEMRELREMTRVMVDLLDNAGYGEVRTPTLEYERAMAGAELGPSAAYRLIDEHGDALVLRSDMTVPIVRVAVTRYETDDLPLRFSYLARAWRRVKPRSGEAREILQLGAELIGSEPIDAAAELLALCGEVLSSAGLADWQIGLGDARILGELLEASGASDADSRALLEAVRDQDLVTVDALAKELGVPQAATIARTRINGDDLEGFDPVGIGINPDSAAWSDLTTVVGALSPEFRTRVVLDLGLAPKIDYYDGIVFEAYDPAIGRALGGGGSYDALMRAFGSSASGFGFALDTELVHAAVAGEERGEGS